MIITNTRCAFRRHYVTGSILLSTLFTMVSFLVLIVLGAKLMRDSSDIIDWILMVAAIPLIRSEITHYREITHHLLSKGKRILGSNSIHYDHESRKLHGHSKMNRTKRKY